MARVLLSAVLLASCASQKPVAKQSVDAAFAPPAAEVSAPVRPSPRSRESWAKSFRRPGECEAAARLAGAQEGADTGWAQLKACVSRPDFGLLETLLENWPQDLKARPEAPPLLAQVIANRGGSIGPDLVLVQQRRLGLFELQAALGQPEAFKGRSLLFVGKVESLKSGKGRAELVVAEQSRGSSTSVVLSGPLSGSTSSSSSSSSGSARVSTTGVLGSGSGSYSRSSSSSSGSVSGAAEQRITSEFADTGQRVMVRLSKPDPFIAVDRNFVFLVRFDGAKQEDVDDSVVEAPTLVALVTLVSYHDVSAEGVISR